MVDKYLIKIIKKPLSLSIYILYEIYRISVFVNV